MIFFLFNVYPFSQKYDEQMRVIHEQKVQKQQEKLRQMGEMMNLINERNIKEKYKRLIEIEEEKAQLVISITIFLSFKKKNFS